MRKVAQKKKSGYRTQVEKTHKDLGEKGKEGREWATDLLKESKEVGQGVWALWDKMRKKKNSKAQGAWQWIRKGMKLSQQEKTKTIEENF